MNPSDQYVQMISQSPDAVQNQPGSSPAYEGTEMDREMPGLGVPSAPFEIRYAELVMPYYLGREKKFKEHRVNPTKYPLLSSVLIKAFDQEDEGEREDESADEPAPEDITITPSGPLGSQLSVGVVEGKHIGTFNTEEQADDAIKAYMEKNQFWPSVWFISDHGNVSPYKLSAAITADAESGGEDREALKAENFAKLAIETPEEFGIKYQGKLEELAAEKDLGQILGYSLRSNKIEVIGEDKILLIDYDLNALHTRDWFPLQAQQIEPAVEPEAEPAEPEAEPAEPEEEESV